MYKPVALMAAALFVVAVACSRPPALEFQGDITEAHCQREDLSQAFGIDHDLKLKIAPNISPGEPRGLRDSYATEWSRETRFDEIQSEIGCLTRVYNSVENGRNALNNPAPVLFVFTGVELRPLKLTEGNPIVVPAIGHQSLAVNTDASIYKADSGSGSSEVSRDYVATTVMFRRATVVVTITASANCFDFNRRLCDTLPDLLVDMETVDGLVSLARIIDGRIEANLG